MKITSKSCQHQRLISTAHGRFCLDCGWLDIAAAKTGKAKQAFPMPSLTVLAEASVRPDGPLLRQRRQIRPAGSSGSSIRISVADITPKAPKPI